MAAHFSPDINELTIPDQPGMIGEHRFYNQWAYIGLWGHLVAVCWWPSYSTSLIFNLLLLQEKYDNTSLRGLFVKMKYAVNVADTGNFRFKLCPCPLIRRYVT